jgi:hypothetical protein
LQQKKMLGAMAQWFLAREMNDAAQEVTMPSE